MFEIEYQISDDEWLSSASKRWEAEEEPIGDLFEGNVRILASRENIFGSDPYPMSVANLAVGLAGVHNGLAHGANGVLKFFQLEDGLEISFSAHGNDVQVSYNGAPLRQWSIGRRAIMTGISEFVRRFCDDLVTRVPEPFQWKELRNLRDLCGRQ